MRRALVALSVLAVPLASAGCASTKVLSSWTAPDFVSGTVKRVLVVGVARDAAIRRSYEDDFSLELTKREIAAIPSYTWAPDLDPERLDRADIEKRLKAEGTTHVLVTRMIDKRTQETYHPPTTMSVGYAPGYPGYYGGWYSFYSTAYVSPGYVSTQEIVSLETNLYAVNQGEGKLVWSGVTETFLASSPMKDVQAVISALVYELRAKKII